MATNTGGGLLTYYVVRKGDDFDYRFYARRGVWTTRHHEAAFMTQELAEKIAKRYQAQVEENKGYDIHFRADFASVDEPESAQALAKVVRMVKRDGLALPTILVQVEKVFHENGNTR